MSLDYVEKSTLSDGRDLLNFCWSGAKDRVEALSDNELDALLAHLEMIFADREEVTDTDINDYIWFEDEEWKEAIGLSEDDEEEDEEEDDKELDEEV